MKKIKEPGRRRHRVKQKLVDIYGQKCYYCDKDMKYNDLTFDHIYPKSLTKKINRNNVSVRTCVLACFPCNQLKNDSIISIEDFRKERMGAKYYPFKDKGLYIDIPLKKKTKKKKAKDEYAHNVIYPKNPIVKRQMTGRRFLKELLINLANKL